MRKAVHLLLRRGRATTPAEEEAPQHLPAEKNACLMVTILPLLQILLLQAFQRKK
jgi:hypothetical protein